MDNSIWLMLLLQVVLISLNAIFAAAEIAVVSMNDNKMAKMAKEGNKKAQRLIKLTGQPARFLATIQVAITLSGFLGSAFAADNFAEPLVELILKTGIGISTDTLNSIVVILITLILSYFTLVFGELVPKRVAMKKTESLALSLSGLIYAVSIVFKPLVSFLTLSTNAILCLLRIDPNSKDDEISEEDIRMSVDVGFENGTIDITEKEIIQNVFEFDDLTAGEIAVHRTEVSILWLEETLDDWDNTIHSSRHKVYPVCDETVDNIVGLLDAKDYFSIKDKTKENVLNVAVHGAYFVPENIKLDVLFKDMKQSKNNFAIVVDEHGGTTGIITMNDLLEELVGNFDWDKNKENTDFIENIDSKTWKITGNPSIDEIEETLDVSIKNKKCETFNGLVVDVLGAIPSEGDSFEIETDGLLIKVEDVKNHCVKTAVVSKTQCID